MGQGNPIPRRHIPSYVSALVENSRARGSLSSAVLLGGADNGTHDGFMNTVPAVLGRRNPGPADGVPLAVRGLPGLGGGGGGSPEWPDEVREGTLTAKSGELGACEEEEEEVCL